MEEHIVKILSTEYITPDVKRFKIEKPKGYTFEPGQATDVSINLPEWKSRKNPFTFTSLNEWKELEFTIKIYEDHQGVTNQLGKLREGDQLIIREPWGAIKYLGKGTFIAGGAGVTPFIAILRQLQKDKKLNGNKLIFSNKTSEDIIMKREFENMLGDNFYPVLTREHVIGFSDRRIDEDYLKRVIRNFSEHFYICGPEDFVKSIQDILVRLGAQPDTVIFEK
jgi:ferredoxin-NADP reductase